MQELMAANTGHYLVRLMIVVNFAEFWGIILIYNYKYYHRLPVKLNKNVFCLNSSSRVDVIKIGADKNINTMKI